MCSAGTPGSTARFKIDWRPGTYTTTNVIAETTSGDPNNVIVVGAHLDSVGVGPGINDNGSGSAMILEIAEQMSKVKPRNKVRFIWFGAEESGLLGSEAYVASLSVQERSQIAAMLNFDMVGSPNFVRFVYDGDLSDSPPLPGGAPEGSAAIETLFLDYFASQGLATEPTAFDGRSDYGPFIEAGIPAGGLFTGAEGIKTAEQAAIYGGVAGEQYDPCYHLSCDDIDNLSLTALDQMSDAALRTPRSRSPRAPRKPAGYRVYDQRTLDRLAFIARAKQLGCSLEEITGLTVAWDGGQCGPIQDQLRELVAGKIAAAQNQITELATFAAELMQAAAALERHRPDGACDTDCGCVNEPDGTESAAASGPAIDLTGKPTAAGEPAIACTLSAGSMKGRMADWQSLFAHVERREAIDGGVRSVFARRCRSVI